MCVFLKSVKCGRSPKHFWNILRWFFSGFFWCPLNIYHATLLLSSKNHIIFHHNALTFHHKTSYDSSTTSRSATYHWWDVQFETQKFIIQYHVHFYHSTDLKPAMNWISIHKFDLPTAWISVWTPIYGNPSAPPPLIPPTKSPPKAVGKTKKNKRNGRPAAPQKINRWNLKMMGLGIWFSFSRGLVFSGEPAVNLLGCTFLLSKKYGHFQLSCAWLEKFPSQLK